MKLKVALPLLYRLFYFILSRTRFHDKPYADYLFLLLRALSWLAAIKTYLFFMRRAIRRSLGCLSSQFYIWFWQRFDGRNINRDLFLCGIGVNLEFRHDYGLVVISLLPDDIKPLAGSRRHSAYAAF